MQFTPLKMDKLPEFPTARQARGWLLLLGGALALLAPSNARAESTSAAMSVSVEVRRSCAVDTGQVTSIATGANQVVVVRGTVELGCSGFAAAHVTLSHRDAAHEALDSPELPLLVFEELVRPTVQAITAELASGDPDTVFVDVIF